MRISVVALAAAWAGVLAGQAATIGAVLNGASYSAVLSPGCWATLFGENLAAGTAAAQTVPLPRELGGVTVNVGGIAAPILYVSPKQVNFLIPYEASLPDLYGKTTPVVVSRAGTASAAYGIHLSRVAPAIFSRDASGTGRGSVFDARFRPVETVKAGDTLIFYAAGLGATDGGAAGAVTEPLAIYLGERLLEGNEVLFAGQAPGYPGIYQINVRAPEGMVTDRLYLRAGGWQSNIVDLGIAAGDNAANVKGEILGLYPPAPANTPPYMVPPATGLREGFTVMLEAVAFSVSLDVGAGARPFAVAAVGEGSAAIVRIDPGAGTWESSHTAPTFATRFGDFSAAPADYRILDLTTCNSAAECFQLPGNRVPPSRVSPVADYALRYLPQLVEPAILTGELKRTGSLEADGKFRVTFGGGAPNAEFGGWLRFPYGPFGTHTSTLKLYVDGRLVASRAVVYGLRNR